MASKIDRRTFVKDSVVASAGAAFAGAAGVPPVPAKTDKKPAPTTNTGKKPSPPADKPSPLTALPKGRIGDLTLSRMVLGGNLLTHFTHSRDLRYVYSLAAHYNTDEKILETLALAEANGIDTVAMHNPPGPMSLLREYRRRGGKIQWIICPTAPVEPGMARYKQEVQDLIDDGCEAIYLWGVRADSLVATGKIDMVAEAVAVAKAQGVPSGVGCHELEVVRACEEHDIDCDFYIKTFHHHSYPSAKLDFDSMWCKNPEETIECMAKVTKPWIAFKTMAAGAIPPRNALKYVFRNGADFVFVGMFDYEIAEDVQIVKEVLADVKKRPRPWRG